MKLTKQQNPLHSRFRVPWGKTGLVIHCWKFLSICQDIRLVSLLYGFPMFLIQTSSLKSLRFSSQSFFFFSLFSEWNFCKRNNQEVRWLSFSFKSPLLITWNKNIWNLPCVTVISLCMCVCVCTSLLPFWFLHGPKARRGQAVDRNNFGSSILSTLVGWKINPSVL